MNDTIELRIDRIKAFHSGDYTMITPPVTTVNWCDESWMNCINFNNPYLTGFLPYDKDKHEQAMNVLRAQNWFASYD